MHAKSVEGKRTGERRRGLLRHYLEMIVVMIVSMALLGMIVSLIFAVAGHSNLYHYAGFRAFIMATNMTGGMVAWMRFRGHDWPSTLEMAGAMFLPVLLLIGPYAAGAFSGGVLLLGMHLLMLPLMWLAMLHRREEYSSDHRIHMSRRWRTSHV